MQVINSLQIGGAERVAINIAANIDSSRFESTILTIEGLGPFRTILDDFGLEYITLEKGSGTRPSLFFKVAREVMKRKIDIVTTHNYGPLFYGGIGARLAGVKNLLHVDHARAFPSKRNIVSEKLLSSMAYKVIAVSNELKGNLMKYEGMRFEDIDIILNGIDEKQFNINFDKNLKKTQLGLNKNHIIIGVGVRLAEQKGLAYLIDAAKIIREKRNDFQVVIGGDGPMREELEKRSISLGLSDCIRFLGARLDLNEIIQLFDIYALSSVWEGLPLCILEAMAARCSIVATHVGGVPDVISHNDNGLLVAPKDPNQLAAAIELLMNNPSKRVEFGNKAYEVFIENYSAKKMADTYASYYEQMI